MITTVYKVLSPELTSIIANYTPDVSSLYRHYPLPDYMPPPRTLDYSSTDWITANPENIAKGYNIVAFDNLEIAKWWGRNVERPHVIWKCEALGVYTNLPRVYVQYSSTWPSNTVMCAAIRRLRREYE